eukprot:Hpha_TRINITY_DN30524_c0_g1::TRINITY_DN30524_c0_g1_i1::g.193730::m.193730
MGGKASRVQRKEGFEVLRDAARSASGVLEAKGRVFCLAVSPQAGLILAGSHDAVLAWRIADFSYHRAFPTGSKVHSVAASSDGGYVIAGTFVDGTPTLRRFLLTRRVAPAPFERMTGGGGARGGGFKKGVEAALDKSYVVEARGVATSVLDALTGPAGMPAVSMQAPCRLFTFPDDPALVCVCAPPHAVVWNLEADQEEAALGGGYPKADCPFAVVPSTRHFLVGRGSQLHLMRWSGKKERSFNLRVNQNVDTILVHKMVAYASAGTSLHKVNMLSGAVLFSWTAEGPISCLATQGGIVFSGARRENLQMWDARNGRVLGGCAVTQTKGIITQGLACEANFLMVADDPEEGRGFQSLVKVYDIRSILAHVPWAQCYSETFAPRYVRPPGSLEGVLGLRTAAATLTAATDGVKVAKRQAGVRQEARGVDPVELMKLTEEVEGRLTHEQIRYCVDLFKRFDANADGVIDRMEFQEACGAMYAAAREAGQHAKRMSLAEVEHVFHGWDVRGGLPFNEFVLAVARQFGDETVAALQLADQEGKSASEASGGILTPHQVRELRRVFAKYDLDGSGLLDRQEIDHLWQDVASSAEARGEGAVSFPAGLLERVWLERKAGAVGLDWRELCNAVARHMSLKQRAAFLNIVKKRRQSPPDNSSPRAAAPSSQQQAQRLSAAGDVAELMRQRRQNDVARGAAHVSKRRDSAKQRNKEATDPRRVVLRVADIPIDSLEDIRRD